jgi:hypothetical protein
VEAVLFGAMDYDVSNPDRQDADLISYAAGHKALGLYSMWALRNEVIRIGAPQLLPRHVTVLFEDSSVPPQPDHQTPCLKFNSSLDGIRLGHPPRAFPRSSGGAGRFRRPGLRGYGL